MSEKIKEILDNERYINKDGYVENINLLPDEIHKLLDYITNLQNQLQQKESIIKEAMKYIKEHSTTIDFKTMRADHNLNMNELLEILDRK